MELIMVFVFLTLISLFLTRLVMIVTDYVDLLRDLQEENDELHQLLSKIINNANTHLDTYEEHIEDLYSYLETEWDSKKHSKI